LDLVAHGVTVVGEVPSGFPTPAIPDISLSELRTLALAAVGVAFVTLADTSALSRSLAAKRGDDVDPNQEIAALGAANLAAGLFQGFPVSASASRSAVAEDTGSRTQLTGVVGAAAIVLILVAFNGIMTDLPTSTLAAIVIAAAMSLFDLPTLRWLWRVRRTELMFSMAALLGVALVGVLQGIVIAIALSLADFIRRAWRPYDAVLGRLPYQRGYHDIERHDDAQQIPGLVLYRFDAPIFFANADWFEESVKAAVAARDEPVAWVIVAAEPITDIDTTGADMLTDLLGDLEREGIDLAFAELKGPVKDRLRRYELYDRVGDDRFFPTLGTAIDAYLHITEVQWEDPAPPL
jgi:MFS superfamily sulfate permease-like transporter